MQQGSFESPERFAQLSAHVERRGGKAPIGTSENAPCAAGLPNPGMRNVFSAARVESSACLDVGRAWEARGGASHVAIHCAIVRLAVQ